MRWCLNVHIVSTVEDGQNTGGYECLAGFNEACDGARGGWRGLDNDTVSRQNGLRGFDDGHDERAAGE